jgi:hypothetical protein
MPHLNMSTFYLVQVDTGKETKGTKGPKERPKGGGDGE